MRRRAVAFALLYLCAILYLSLYPWTFLGSPVSPELHWVIPSGRRLILDAFLNFFFYAPLGLAIGLAARDWRIGVLLAAILGGCCSLGVEWLQLWTPNRNGNLLDSATNTLGSLTGAASVGLVRLFAPRFAVNWRLAPHQQVFAALWLAWFAFPFVPRISLPVTIAQFTHPAPWVSHEFATALGGVALLRMMLGPSPWLAVLWIAAAAQAVLVDRTLSPASVLGATAGWILAARAPRPRHALTVLFPLWLILDELRPFTVSEVSTPFAWAPFESWFSVSTTAYYATIFQKLFYIMATLWLLRRAGWRYLWIGPGLAVVLLACEWLQQWLPDRTPETTDAVLALLGCAILKLTETAPEPCSN